MIEKELIHSLIKNFEDFSNQTDDKVEFWLARDLQHLLGYTKLDNFQNVISKAKTACEVSGQDISDHFADVGKMVKIGSGAEKEVDDIMLTRYACYLIAQNGDSKKEQIAFAQTYFALQTRKADFMPTILLKAKDFATEITIYNARENNMQSSCRLVRNWLLNCKRANTICLIRTLTL